MKKVILSVILAVATLFAASPGDIVVNEIMFNGPESGTDNEWVELHNVTGATIHLDSTWQLTDGEGTFVFPDVDIMGGGYLTIKVAENDSVPFPFTPDLDAVGLGILLGNSYDQLVIREGTVTIDSVNYDDDWGGDGDGKSLERIDPMGPSNAAANWGGSTPDGGTPGAVNSIYGTVDDYPPTVSGIEHTPLTPTPDDTVTINATITDDGTISKALCFFSIDDAPDDSVAMADDGAHNDGSAGDDVYGAFIMPVPVGSTVRYYLVVEDDSLHSDTSWTFAYTVTSGDTVDGDLVVNEIMYNPIGSDSYGEFIEFYNRGTVAIDASGWKVKDDNDYNEFEIPDGVIIAAGEFLVIAKNPDSIEARYSITGVVGSVSWGLNNSPGDAVRLYDDAGTLMDYVYFGNDDPWPTAPNGDGPSLELIDPAEDNNDAANWQASAGEGTPGSANSTDVFETGYRPDDYAILEVYPNPFN
ncbi:hypothetical protein DRQ36_10200, partial [bacterium]